MSGVGQKFVILKWGRDPQKDGNHWFICYYLYILQFCTTCKQMELYMVPELKWVWLPWYKAMQFYTTYEI